MIKVLHFVATMSAPGGVQSLLSNYYECMDHNKVAFDFAAFDNRNTEYRQKYENMGAKIHYIPPKKKGLVAHIREIARLFDENSYTIVHTHQNFRGALTIWIAKRKGVKTRIVHSHRSNAPESTKVRLIRKIMTPWIIHNATDLWACGQDAALWLYGKKRVESGCVRILPNAIHTDRFAYDQQMRDKMRGEYDLEGKFVIGNVSRFNTQKNHARLIDIFDEIHRRIPNAVLFLVGDGELKTSIQEKVHKLGLDEFVIFAGARTDVPNMLQLMDFFVLSSDFEGLPVVLLEAQCNGLACIAGDNITKEVAVTDNMFYVPQNASPAQWADVIEEKMNYQRKDGSGTVRAKGYDIHDQAKTLEEFYLGC